MQNQQLFDNNFRAGDSNSSQGGIGYKPQTAFGRFLLDNPLNNAIQGGDIRDLKKLDDPATNFKVVFHEQMMEQIHPLRGKQFHEIFPVFSYFYPNDEERNTYRDTFKERMTDHRAVSPLRAQANFLEQAGTAGHRALK